MVMRNFLTIPLLILMSFSGMRVSIAYHFCGGEQVSSRLSLSGKPASCGMEDDEQSIPVQTSLNSHCCDNSFSAYTLANTYLPASQVNVTSHLKISDHQISFSVRDKSLELSAPVSQYNVRPPGKFSQIPNTQPVLCIFRI
jgi:hypothetical protein